MFIKWIAHIIDQLDSDYLFIGGQTEAYYILVR